MLLEEVKNYLDITWEDETTNKKVTGLIARGQSYLNGIAGKELDFEEEGKAKELLFEYCLYARSYGLADFQNNYLHELLKLQMEVEIEEHSDV